MIGEPHDITTVEDTGAEVTRECTCGWVTVGSIPEPDHHTPLVQREQEHLDQEAKLADGSVWDEVRGRSYHFELFLRRRWSDQTPNHVVVNAVWMGGFREVLRWPWDAAGLAEAQAWCDEHRVIWSHSGFPIQPGSLAVHA